MGCNCGGGSRNSKCKGNVARLTRNRSRLNTFYRTTSDLTFKEEVRLLIIEVEALLNNSSTVCPDNNTIQVITNFININNGR